jgi:2-alkenal reductase
VEEKMIRSHKFRLAVLGSLIGFAAVTAIACTGASNASPATSGVSSEPTAAVQTVPVINTEVPVAAAKGDAPTPLASSSIASALDIVAAQEQVLVDIYERVVPSVVHILIRQGTTFSGEGSGFVLDTDGHILTNYHVVQGSSGLRVLFQDGSDYDATVVGTDPDSDLAVIKIDAPASRLVPAVLGNSSEVKPGQMAIAIGNPFGRDFTMTTGIISAVGRVIDSGFSIYKIPSVIQTDAAINPGNSGGPLLDREGRVIGINAQIESGNRQNSGVGFAVPIDLAKRVSVSLIAKGRHDYAYLGISGQDVNRDVRQRGRLPDDLRGAVLTTVAAGSAADRAGLKGDSVSAANINRGQTPNYDGDVIVAINDIPITTIDDLIAYLALHTSPGETTKLTVFRGGRQITVEATLGSRPRT